MGALMRAGGLEQRGRGRLLPGAQEKCAKPVHSKNWMNDTTPLHIAEVLPPCPPELQGEHRAQEDGEDVGAHLRILQQHPPHPVRKGQRPVSIGHVRQHPLHQVRRRHMGPLRIA